MRSATKTVFGVLTLVTASQAQADTLVLKNGNVMQGSYAGGSARAVTFVSVEGARDLETKDIASITFSAPAAAPAPAPAGAPASSGSAAGSVVVPAGTAILARSIDTVTSKTPAGTLFGMKLDSDLRVGNTLVAKAGTKLYGKVEASEQAGRVAGKSELAIGIASIEINGTRVPLVSDVLVGTGEGSFKKTARRTIVGAAIGGAVGGKRGAARGAGAGAATTLLTPGQTIGISPNTLLQFSLEQAVTLSAAGG